MDAVTYIKGWQMLAGFVLDDLQTQLAEIPGAQGLVVMIQLQKAFLGTT